MAPHRALATNVAAVRVAKVAVGSVGGVALSRHAGAKPVERPPAVESPPVASAPMATVAVCGVAVGLVRADAVGGSIWLAIVVAVASDRIWSGPEGKRHVQVLEVRAPVWAGNSKALNNKTTFSAMFTYTGTVVAKSFSRACGALDRAHLAVVR